MIELNEEQKQAFSKAAALCSRAEKSPGSIQNKLEQWGLSPEDAEPVMQQLFQHQFLDEERFACSYVRDKFRFNQWGRVKIAFHLRAERISPAAIQKALEELDEESYYESLKTLMREKLRKTKGANSYDLKAKIFRFAQSRGFEQDLIFSVYKELTND
ncbi:regulatory protein RecX [Mangrovibacterium diazotrophicum]|uniref:Regulatory protein RecX n=1 Tax=Mangrovibacterium diazotrophicum TaxID=1261403 RepID=A0A419WB33_9BACT|nr:regulatory protein RecX [Mangrovibacterium diazotrophicum]RKD92678.1 regulatory protein [Mangrovibacterium diazotrophicum]